MSAQDIRWKQRFSNFKKALHQLDSAVLLSETRELTDLEKQGLIQSFEYTFELAWKTLKDYLETNNVETQFPRDVIKKSFQYNILDSGDIWIDMLEKRNLMAHTYDETNAKIAYNLILKNFYPQLALFYASLAQHIHEQ